MVIRTNLRYLVFCFCLSVLSIGFLAFLNPCHARSHKNIQQTLSKLDQHIKNAIQKNQIPGCAIAVVHRNEIIFMQAYGVKTIGKSEKIDLDTLFQLGSVSKPVAATLASVLETKGYLSMDDPVHDYLPNFSIKNNKSRHSLKIKHILSHSSGVPRSGFNNLIESNANMESHLSHLKILKTLQNVPMRSPIGKRYDYHNAMYSLISDITESATGLSFKESLKINLLKPLQMHNTSTTLSGLLNTSNRATPHVKAGKGHLVPCQQYSSGYYAVAPAGGINSSVRDMANFLKAQLGGYPEVLNHKALARIQTPQVPTNTALSTCECPSQIIKNAHYALGWRVVDFDRHKLIFHGGWVKGFTNFIGFMPEEEIGIVVLHNGESKFSSKTSVKFFELYLDIPKSKSGKKPQKSSKTTKLAKQFSNSNHTHKKPPTKKLKLKTVSTQVHTKRVSKPQ